MLQRLHGSPTAHGYRALGGDGHSHMSYASPPAELSHDGTGTLHYSAPSKGTLTSSKSFGDIRAMAGRQRTKKSRSAHSTQPGHVYSDGAQVAAQPPATRIFLQPYNDALST